MFEVKGEDKEVLKKAVTKFVLDSNEYLDENDITEKYTGKIKKLEKVPGVNTETIRKKIDDVGEIRFGMEEIDDGWKVIVPGLTAITDVPVFGKAFKGFIGQSMSSLRSALDKMRYCRDCEKIREEDVCPECDNETEEIDYKVR